MSSKNKPLVSIIVPIYNSKKYLAECLNSILSQTYKNIEVILVNDGSTDGSEKIIQSYAARHSNFVVINKKNGGLSSARNSGIRKATGKYLCFIDSDDTVSPTFIEILLNAITSSKEISISCCRYTRRANQKLYVKSSAQYKKVPSEHYLIKTYLQNDASLYSVSVWNKMFATELFNEVKFPAHKLYEDFAIIDQLTLKANSVAVVDKNLYYYRMRDDSITTEKFNIQHIDMLEHCNKLLDKYKNNSKLHNSLKIMKYTRCIELLTKAQKSDTLTLKDKQSIFGYIKQERASVIKAKGVRKTIKLSAIISLLGLNTLTTFNNIRQKHKLNKTSSRNCAETVNSILFILYFISFLFICEFFGQNKTIFAIRHIILLVVILLTSVSFVHRYKSNFHSSSFRCKELLYVLPLGAFFIIMSLVKSLIAETPFSLRSMTQTFLFVGPTFYAFLVANVMSQKRVYNLLKVVLWVFIVFYFTEPCHQPMDFLNLENWRNISPFNSNSFTESSICAESFLQLFVIFFFIRQNGKKSTIKHATFYTVLSFIFTILSFKRLGMLFAILLIVFSKIINYTKKIHFKFKATIFATLFTIATIAYLAFLQGDLFPSVDANKITTHRSWILSLWERKNFFSYGYGTSLYIIGRYLEMDLIQIYLELGMPALWLFCFIYSKMAGKTIYSNLLTLYAFGNLLTASALPWSSGWLLFSLALAYTSSNPPQKNNTPKPKLNRHNIIKKIKNHIKQLFVRTKYTYYCISCRLKKNHDKNLWLISERGDEARDNGYFFYKYLKEEHPKINVKYIIARNSVDRKRIAKEDIIEYGSKEHYIAFITAKYHISTHIMGCSPDFRLFLNLDRSGKVKLRAKEIFLQHGITKDSATSFNSLHLDAFIAGAEPEYNILQKECNNISKSLRYTGFARYDNLLDYHTKHQILVMPTWRQNLSYCSNLKSFKATEYYQNWSQLLRNTDLLYFLEKNNIQLLFYPHYEIQPYISAFKSSSPNITVCDFNHYDVQELLKESELLITDYSSVFFDFAYMKKPLIYFQFDYDDYRKNHYQEGYYSYIHDGFGPIAPDIKTMLKYIEDYYAKNLKVEQKYIINRRRFFTLEPDKNCERIYKTIINLK